MNNMEPHSHHTVHKSHQHHKQQPVKENHFALAFSATVHCLTGCGLGEVLGTVTGTWLHWNNASTMILAIVLGAILGFLFGMYPLLKAKFSVRNAFRIVLIGEGLSIAVMETVEAIVQWNTPGLMDAHLNEWSFWRGMMIALAAGFIAAFPVNYIMVKRGIRHKH
jgi:putative flippase GtrA